MATASGDGHGRLLAATFFALLAHGLLLAGDWPFPAGHVPEKRRAAAPAPVVVDLQATIPLAGPPPVPPLRGRPQARAPASPSLPPATGARGADGESDMPARPGIPRGGWEASGGLGRTGKRANGPGGTVIVFASAPPRRRDPPLRPSAILVRSSSDPRQCAAGTQR